MSTSHTEMNSGNGSIPDRAKGCAQESTGDAGKAEAGSPRVAAGGHADSDYFHHDGDIDYANGDRVRWCNGWWMADRHGGKFTKHMKHADAVAALKSDEEVAK